MSSPRTLRLRSDALTDLTSDELRAVAAGDATLGPICAAIADGIQAAVNRWIRTDSVHCEAGGYQA